MIYWDDHKCPPLVEKRKRREKASRAKQSVRWMEKELGAKADLEKGEQHEEPEADPGRKRAGRRSNHTQDGGAS